MLRPDEFASVYFSRPFRKVLGRPGGLPILMYHSVSGRTEQGHPYYRTVTSPEVFATQMSYLADNGYTVILLSDAVQFLRAGDSTMARAAVITFDDGYRDFYTNAFPILNRHGFPATVYLPTAYIATEVRRFKEADCMTWSQIRELESAGIDFGSHTVTHPQLREVGISKLAYEFHTSKDVIEQCLGRAVTSFAYPYAFPEEDRTFIQIVRENMLRAGYASGVTTILGTVRMGDDYLFLKRLPINSSDGTRLFAAKLEGAYDWCHSVQYARKLVKGVVAR